MFVYKNRMGNHCSSPALKKQKDDDEHVKFWFGDLWPLVKTNRWDLILDQLETSQYAKRINKKYPDIDDYTKDKISKKYGDYGVYRQQHASDVIKEIRSLLGKNIESMKNIIYPVNMVDSIGRSDFSLIAYNRQTYNRQILLWPLPYHVDECRKGFDDMIPFSLKQFGVVFRGSCSSPLYSKDIDVNPPIKKTSRYEIVLRNRDYPWADLGLTKLNLYENDPNYDKEYSNLQMLDRGNLTREEQMRYKFVLCIEGADISTSFGWVLASHCVAIHPYPFLFEVWYFQDLQPWVHFIPIAWDGSDLPDIMEWCRLHPQECENIARNSREYMHKMCDPLVLVSTKKQICDIWKLKKTIQQ